MASGVLGTPADLAAGTYTTLYTVPASTFAIASVSVVNRSNTALTVRLAVAAASTPTNAEFIEYDSTIAPKGILERTGIVMQAGKLLVVYSSAVNCNALVFGIETAT